MCDAIRWFKCKLKPPQNADDFELSNIIDTFDKETRQQKQLVPGDNNITAIPPIKT